VSTGAVIIVGWLNLPHSPTLPPAVTANLCQTPSGQVTDPPEQRRDGFGGKNFEKRDA